MKRVASLSLLALALFAITATPSTAQGAPATDEASTALITALSDDATLALPELDASVPTPASVLGYPLGARFTHHERILDYLQTLADASPRVTMWRYGETYEGRPLSLLAISKPETLSRLEEIRTAHLRIANAEEMTDEARDELLAGQPAIVWLAYGVHGNESSSAEAAMATAYVFAAGGGEIESLLDNAIVLIDPLVNPDGRERYVHGYEQQRGREPNASQAASEHYEPWPGGRQNHYLIDLNRDWAWISQIETEHRIVQYRRWEPHVYVDYHEMFHNSSYFFPPAADPIHYLIDGRTVDWLDAFGEGNAAAFDDHGWMYYKAENFDLFYPGYGDSYPGLRSGVGMTYEMAGHGFAGQAIERSDGSLLTLADRIARHFTTSIATVRTAARNRAQLVRDFADVRRTAAQADPYVYLWDSEQPEADELAQLLDTHGIEVHRLSAETQLRARPLDADEAVKASDQDFGAGTYVVSSRQPLGNLVRTLLDRDPKIDQEFLADQRERVEKQLRVQFYDISAWSLPLAYNIRTWTATTEPANLAPYDRGNSTESTGSVETAGKVGFLVRPDGVAGFRFAGALQRHGLRYRVALENFEIADAVYPAGTLFVPHRLNPETLVKTLVDLAAENGVEIVGVDSSYSSAGPSLGSDQVPMVKPAKIGILSGDGVSVTSFGFLWHLLDQTVQIPVTRILSRRVGSIDLDDFDVLIVPEAFGLGNAVGEEGAEAIKSWVRGGGTLVAVGGTHSWLKGQELTSIESWKPPEAEQATEASEVEGRPLSERRLFVPGVILSTRIADSHPLTIGLPSPPPALYAGATVLLPTGDSRQDVLVAKREDSLLAGSAWNEAAERIDGSLLVGVERQGRGSVVTFSQDPVFRLFWRGTAPIFLNAVMHGPSLGTM